MVVVFRYVVGEGSREWEFEEHFCFEESMECWWEESHRIVGFEYDEKEDIAYVSAWFLEHTVAYGVREVEGLYCNWDGVYLYKHHHDRYRDFEIVGYKYSEILEEEKQVTYFDLKNGLHLSPWW